MNLYFSSVFTQEQSNLPEFDDIINNRLSSILCTAIEVEKYLKTLNAHRSPGTDLIPPCILKECVQYLSNSNSDPLCAFLNKSFATGLLPTDWKIANIKSIHKKGHKYKKKNYRQMFLQRNSLYRTARIANFDGILGFSVPSIILVKARLMQITM